MSASQPVAADPNGKVSAGNLRVIRLRADDPRDALTTTNADWHPVLFYVQLSMDATKCGLATS